MRQSPIGAGGIPQSMVIAAANILIGAAVELLHRGTVSPESVGEGKRRQAVSDLQASIATLRRGADAPKLLAKAEAALLLANKLQWYPDRATHAGQSASDDADRMTTSPSGAEVASG